MGDPPPADKPLLQFPTQKGNGNGGQHGRSTAAQPTPRGIIHTLRLWAPVGSFAVAFLALLVAVAILISASLRGLRTDMSEAFRAEMAQTRLQVAAMELRIRDSIGIINDDVDILEEDLYELGIRVTRIEAHKPPSR